MVPETSEWMELLPYRRRHPLLRFSEYARPDSPEEASALLLAHPHATILGGMMWLRLQDRTIPYAIDLSSCGLDYVRYEDGKVSIGAMATIEKARGDEALERLTTGAFAEATEGIVGTQFRNGATVGGSVFSRMGFSDILACLLPFDATVTLSDAGTMPLAAFARMGTVHDVLTEVTLEDAPARAAFEGVRLSATDFSALNACAVWQDGSWRLAVGSLPKRAQLVDLSSAALSDKPTDAELDEVERLVAALPFGSDMRGSADWRREAAPRLARRAIMRAAAKPLSSENPTDEKEDAR